MALLVTVRGRLALLLMSVLLLPSAYSLGEAIAHFFRQQEAAYSSMDRYAALVSAEIAARLDDVVRLASNLSREELLLGAANSTAQGPACSNLLARAIRPYPTYSNAALFDLTGHVICAARNDQPAPSVQDRDWFQNVIARKDLAIGAYVVGRSTGEPILPFGMPVLDEAGRLRGVLGLAVRTAWLEPRSFQAGIPSGGALFILDKSGLSATETLQDNGKTALLLPPREALDPFLRGDLRRFESQGRDGVSRLYALNPIDQYDLFVLLGQDRHLIMGPLWRDLLVQCGVLLLICLLGAVLAVTGIRLLITKWLDRLARLARDYINARTVSFRKLTGAPTEIRELGDVMQEMGQRARQQELQYLKSLDDKREMLRELHHRVKNNMQIVNSYLSLYARTSRASLPPGHASMSEIEELQLRTGALALVQRYLYDDENLREVRIVPILSQLCRHFANRGGQQGDLSFSAENLNATLAADRVVSLVLLITEVVSRVLHLTRENGGNQTVVILLEQDGGEINVIRVIVHELEPALSLGVTSKDRPMIMAFVKQLRAHISLSDQPPFEIRIAFGARDLSVAVAQEA